MPRWECEQWHYAEAEWHHTMFTIKFGELPGSRMYTMKQLSGAALYVRVQAWKNRLCTHMTLILIHLTWAKQGASATIKPFLLLSSISSNISEKGFENTWVEKKWDQCDQKAAYKLLYVRASAEKRITYIKKKKKICCFLWFLCNLMSP